MVQLVAVENHPDAKRILFDLLAERDDSINISHEEMPTWGAHCAFVDEHPYTAWYIVENGATAVGSVYLTKPAGRSTVGDEIGIFLFQRFHGLGFAEKALNLMFHYHPRDRYIAHINPDNARSIRFFERMGFELCQRTYEFLQNRD